VSDVKSKLRPVWYIKGRIWGSWEKPWAFMVELQGEKGNMPEGNQELGDVCYLTGGRGGEVLKGNQHFEKNSLPRKKVVLSFGAEL